MPTNIEWTNETWNPVTGCTKISDGCKNCYAERMAKRLAGRCGYPADDPFRVTVHENRFYEPFRWKKPRKVFVCSMGDLFHESVPSNVQAMVLGIAALRPRHIFQILTKRSDRMRDFYDWVDTSPADAISNAVWELTKSDDAACKAANSINDCLGDGHNVGWPMKNVWLGVTVETNDYLYRVDDLINTPASVRFVSCEPMLGQINFDGIWGYPGSATVGMLDNWPIQWVICGGESGPGARPMHPDLARSLRDQCHLADIPFFFKQWGEWAPEPRNGAYRLEDVALFNQQENGSSPIYLRDLESCRRENWDEPQPGDTFMYRVGKKSAGHLLDGKEYRDFPEMILGEQHERAADFI